MVNTHPVRAQPTAGRRSRSRLLPCDHSAPRLARAWVHRNLAGVSPPDGFWRDDIVHDMVLCASELVTNSLIANSTVMTMRLLVEPGLFRLSLVDDGPVLTDSEDPRLHAQAMGFWLIEASSESSGITLAGLERELWALFRASESGAEVLTPIPATLSECRE